MKAETWEKLNGMVFGEVGCSETANPSTIFDGPPPLAGEAMRTINDRTYDGEINIPGFMYETTQSVLVPAAAYRAQGVGRLKHAEHQREKQVRHVVNGVFWSLVGFGVFALILNLADKICG